MKKIVIIIGLVFICFSAGAQTQFGIKIAPAISSTRVESNVDTVSMGKNGNTGSFIVGAYVDRFLGNNAYFSLGVLFCPKKINFQVDNLLDENSFEESHKLQYLLIPATFKLVSNEISLDTKLYFQFGLQFDIKIHEENQQNNKAYIKNFKSLGSGLILGTGVEKRISTNNTLYIGFTYRRGLFDVIEDTFPTGEGLVAKNDLFSLDLAVRF